MHCCKPVFAILILLLPSRAPAQEAGQHIYLADTDNHCIAQMDDMKGANWKTFGKKGAGVGEFDQPIGLAVDKEKRIYVSDTRNNRIVRMDDISGKGWAAFGTKGNGTGEFEKPVSVFVEDSGRITILDAGNHRIVQMGDMNGSNWKTLVDETIDDTEIGLRSPNVVVDSKGGLTFPCCRRNFIVHVDDINGANRRTLGKPNIDVMQMPSPFAVGLDKADRLYIACGGDTITRVDDISGKNLKMLFEVVGLGWCPPGGLFVTANGEVYFPTLMLTLCKFTDNGLPIRISQYAPNTNKVRIFGQTRSVVVR
jgi:DNA-directed RNA polymerase subunit N (RpoN/RPB10)